MILALAGGVGGAKLASGLARALKADELLVAVNTGDDFEHLGLHISPDLDTVMYTLAGVANAGTGWGYAGESWRFMESLERLGGPTWFRLGDRDLATHIERSRRLALGESLLAVTRALGERLGVRHAIVPMSDDPVRTIVHTDEGALEFQDYFVRRRCEPRVRRVEYRGAERARPSAIFRDALARKDLRGIIFCPSNPYLSIAPVLAIPGVREAIERRQARSVAVSPIIGGKAVKGPAAKLMAELGLEASSVEIARCYRGLADVLLLDRADAALAGAVEALGLRAHVTDTLMRTDEDRERVARACLEVLEAAGA
ncbi:MAG TPA: 2-phospho-L-lactate transferase [Burkholderiales bacterium]|nr:2-phospho-L-lactate transferase [Burkholderiales bacterium]